MDQTVSPNVSSTSVLVFAAPEPCWAVETTGRSVVWVATAGPLQNRKRDRFGITTENETGSILDVWVINDVSCLRLIGPAPFSVSPSPSPQSLMHSSGRWGSPRVAAGLSGRRNIRTPCIDCPSDVRTIDIARRGRGRTRAPRSCIRKKRISPRKPPKKPSSPERWRSVTSPRGDYGHSDRRVTWFG